MATQTQGIVISDISVIGLGAMGSALAWALVKEGHGVTVWNRSPKKMEPFVAKGAAGATDVASAVQASPVILVCVDNYAVTESFLRSGDVMPHLAGRSVIQFSTGTPKEAREAADWITDCGGAYIEGAILGGPGDIGTADLQILFAGPDAAYAQVEPLVRCLAGKARYLGDNIGAAPALDLAWLCQRYGLFLGLSQGALLCEAEGVSVGLYATMFPEGGRSHSFAEVIHADAFENPTATLSVWEAALRRIQQQALDAGINNEIPEFVSGLFKRAIAAGHGEEHVSARIKLLRKGNGV